ncbi:hypothetical protein BBJ28_00013837 [Nothophytophthora sp. Chile5]|nr:hypothetical protein BBJ28_00013837 [Nothophytophthora sp. Chile5]
MGGTGAIRHYDSSQQAKTLYVPQAMYFLEGGLLMVGNLLKTDSWVQDEVRTHCNVCVQQFLPFRRRHHCRTCGEVVCGGCSSHRTIRLTDVNVECSTRICTFCIIRATDASIKANEDAMRDTLADPRRLSSVSIFSLPPLPEHYRRAKQRSILSVDSELTNGSVVQLWPQPVPANETARLQVARHSTIRSVENDPTMNLLVSILARTLECPVAFIGIMDDESLWLKASVGWDDRATHIPRDDCVCAHTLMQDATMIVSDTSTDKHFHADDLVVGGRSMRYYAGAPIRVRGHSIGVVCALDTEPHQRTSAAMKSTLEAVANIVSEVLEQRVDSSQLPLETDRAANDGMTDRSKGQESRAESNTPIDLHASLHGLNLLSSSRSTASSARKASDSKASRPLNGSPSSYLPLSSVPQEYGDKVSVVMDLFHRLQSSYWTVRNVAPGRSGEVATNSIKAFETFKHGQLFTKSNTKLTGSCRDVVTRLQNYEDARVYQNLFSHVTRRYKLSDQTWMDEMTFRPSVRAADSESLRVLTHWRQYPDGSHVVVAASGAKLYEAGERDFLFGWFVAPCSLDDGLGSVNVSCIAAQPYENQSLEQNLSCDLLRRLSQATALASFHLAADLPEPMPSSPLPMLAPPSFGDNQSCHQHGDSFTSSDGGVFEEGGSNCWDTSTTDGIGSASGSRSSRETATAGSSDEGAFPKCNSAALVSLQQTGQISQLNQNERMMLDLLDKTISTQEILAQQQHEMASVIDHHGTQLERISTAIERVELLLSDSGSNFWLKRASKGSTRSLV